MRKPRGSGHWLGVFLLVVIALAVFGVSVTLSLIFFRSITPAGNAWFTYFGLSLTEGGFLGWLGAFILVRHHGFHTAVEFIMTCLSLGGILATAGVELFSLMPGTSIDVHTPFIANAVGIMLETVFIANVISVFLAAIVFYSEANPGWFRGTPQVATYPQEGYYIAESQGESARPLASPKTQPKEAPANFDQSATIETPQIEEPKPLKPLPPARKPRTENLQPVGRPPQQVSQTQETGIIREGASILLDGMKNLWKRNHEES